MASTYVNDLRLEIMETGDQSGAWGGTTNTNLELIGEAFSYGTEAITTNADTHTSTVADGATDPLRSMYVKYTGALDSTCTVTIAPNTLSKVWFIENATTDSGSSGPYSIIITQGSGANVTIPNGQTKCIATNGGGSGAIVYDVFTDLNVAGDLTVASTVKPLGDTAADDLAAFGYTSVLGAILTGQGSTNDVTLVNDADATVLSIPTGTTNVDITGVATATTFQPDGDTAADMTAAIGYTSVDGLILTGQGSTSDVVIKNDADGTVASIATGTTVMNFASTPTAGDVAIKVAGKESIWIPAAAMYPSTTNGCSDLDQVETTALRPDLKVLDFAADADDFAQFSIAFPKSWNEGTITYQPFWTVTAGTDTGTVVWQLGGIAVTNDATINTAFGTLVATTALAHSGTSNDLMVSAESGAVTIAGSPSTDDVCFFQINNDTSASGQTGVVRLLGIKIFFTTDAANDA
jgi:hypothetical protein